MSAFTTLEQIRGIDTSIVSVTLNKFIFSAIVFAHIYVLFALPLFLLPISGWYGLTLIPFIFMHSTQWGLIHEAIHKHLHPDTKMNEYGGRALSIMLGVSFHVLRFGHLMHHKLNRNWQSELVAKKGLCEKLDYFSTLLGGLYVTEVISSILMALLPQKIFLSYANKRKLIAHSEVYIAGERFFYIKGNIKPLRIDVPISLALYAAAFWLYGPYNLLLLGFLISRAVMISFMDNIYHYGTEIDKAGKDLKMPKWAELLLLNSNYHETHHRNPQIPWKQLPIVHAEQKNIFDGSFVQHGLMQFNGPIVKPSL